MSDRVEGRDGPRRWWGWPGPAEPAGLGERQLERLREVVGPTEAWPHPDTPREVSLPPPAAELAPRLRRELPAIDLDDSHEGRVTHAVGKGYADLARLRGLRLDSAPDLVATPSDRDEVAAVLAWCSEESVAVVPYGGGTSVVGGIEALRDGCEAVLSLDLGRLRDVEVDPVSLTARLGAGLTGPDAESALNRHGLTVGHFPQSHEQATIGGYAATRSAGQASTGYGRFDEIVAGLAMATPRGGSLCTPAAHSGAGPALREAALGSEGALGVITDVTVRVRRLPEARRYEGWMLESFEGGAEAVRRLLQSGVVPEVVRLSDREETGVSIASSEAGPLQGAIRDAYLRLRRRSSGCLLVVGFEGSRDDVARRRSEAASILRRAGGVYGGRSPGASWLRGRFDGPYHRDELMDRGIMVETFETAADWSRLQVLYEAVRSALAGAMREQGAEGLVMCHLSHAYRDGASLYFTAIGPALTDAPVRQWRELKHAASEAIRAAGGTITHHHAVGTDHAPWMRQEVGEVGLEALRGLKGALDPAGVMNPGKLLPGPPRVGRDRKAANILRPWR